MATPRLPDMPKLSTGIAWVVWVATIGRIMFAALESGGREALRELLAGPAVVHRAPHVDEPKRDEPTAEG